MARIPLGNFGNAIAQPAPAVRVTSAAFDNGGSGAQKLGDDVLRISASMADEERQKADALTRARLTNSALDREMAVDNIGREIEQDIAAGKLHYNDAATAYKKRVGELQTPDLNGVDPVTAENFSRSVKRLDFKGEKHIEGIVGKARQGDMRAQADGILDKLGKQAGLPGTDMATITAQIDGMDEIGRAAYGAAWDKRKQDWKDNSWDARLNQQAMAVRNDVGGINALQKQITEGEFADKLDSNRRNMLVARLDGYKTSLIQRAEAANARAERAAERHLKKAEAEFNTFQGLADKGTILAPEYVERTLQMTAGTPYQQGVFAIMQQAQANGGIARQPIRQQQAELDRVDAQIAKTGRTPELDKRREQLQKVLNGSQSDLKENGLRAGLERGVIADMAPLDVSTPEAIAGSMAKRLEQAESVSQWAGKAVSPLDAREAEQIKGMLDALPAKQRSVAVSTIAQSAGPRYAGAIADQLDKQDRPLALAFARAGGRTTGATNWLGQTTVEARHTSELILKGAQAIKDGTAMKDDKKVTGWKSTIAREVEGMFQNEKVAAAVKDSAYYIAAAMSQESGGGIPDLDQAIRLAIGGDVIQRNGKKLPVPAGVSASEFDKQLRNVSADDIRKQSPTGKVRVAGVEMSADSFATSIPGQELIFAGPNRYAVVVRGRPVTNENGKPITIEVR